MFPNSATAFTVSAVAPALIPVILVIFAGFLARRVGLITDVHVAGAERITYVIFFPTLLFSNLSTAMFEDASLWTLTLVLTMVVLVVSAGTWAGLVRSNLDGPAKTSVFQGATRFNSYVVLALAFAVFGTVGVQAISVPLAFMIIAVNVLCVAILARHGTPPEGTTAPSIWKSLATNPLILACFAGLLVNPLHIPWPGSVERAFDWFGNAAIALGLFAVGAGLKPISGLQSVLALAVTSLIKLVVKPLLFVGIAVLVGLSTDLIALGLLAMIVPCATSTYILARQLGGDAPLMAQAVTVGTLLSALTVPVWFYLFAILM
ncbi:MAG: AEC family transporter [Pseudomonadota bacterium]